MATKDEEKLTLQLLIDKENNRVIFAEASKDFIDVLFSLLTLPVGTVVRLLGKQQHQSDLGCMNNLYRSVENLEDEYFGDKLSKTMLLRPRNSAADECRKLKVNIDDTEVPKYYVCQNFMGNHCPEALSTFSHTICSCGITREMILTGVKFDNEKGVFLKGKLLFMITDDLQVMHLSTESTFGLLNNLGVRATDVLEKKTITVNLEKVSSLLKHALFSKAPLTETFLLDHTKRSTFCRPKLEGAHMFSSIMAENSAVQKIQLTIVVQKSTHKTIYAEAGYDFINFLMSLLTVPLGSVVKLLDQAPSLGCITNLYKSVERLNSEKYINSEKHKDMLLSPKPDSKLCCENHILGIEEANPCYFYNNGYSLSTTKLNWYSRSLYHVKLKGLEESTVFMVTNDLVVTPFSSISAIILLEQLKIPINDIEKYVVSIGQEEALRILEASMTSGRALTSILQVITEKQPKQEKC